MTTSLDSVTRLARRISDNSYVHLPAPEASRLLSDFSETAWSDWDEFRASWQDMPLDTYMADGGRYRTRRHATLTAAEGGTDLELMPHQPHYQTVDYNNLNGGIARHYEPIEDRIRKGGTFDSLLTLGARVSGALAPFSRWHIEAHQFRITADGTQNGQPTPEGVHRDGVTFVLMALVDRDNVTGGESTVYGVEKQPLNSFTLTEPRELVFVNDERVFHGVSPVLQDDSSRPGHRDVLVITYRHRA